MDDGYPPEKTPSKDCQTCGPRLNMYLKAMVQKLCFMERGIHVDGGNDLHLEEMEGQLNMEIYDTESKKQHMEVTEVLNVDVNTSFHYAGENVCLSLNAF